MFIPYLQVGSQTLCCLTLTTLAVACSAPGDNPRNATPSADETHRTDSRGVSGARQTTTTPPAATPTQRGDSDSHARDHAQGRGSTVTSPQVAKAETTAPSDAYPCPGVRKHVHPDEGEVWIIPRDCHNPPMVGARVAAQDYMWRTDSPPAEWTVCERDAECEVVAIGCCGVLGREPVISVRRDYAKHARERYRERNCQVACSDACLGCIPPGRAICAEKLCTYFIIP